jgi:hypothetical protein
MAGEKMGSNKKTEQSDEFKRLTNETEVKKVLVDRLCTVNDVYLKTLSMAPFHYTPVFIPLFNYLHPIPPSQPKRMGRTRSPSPNP